MTVAQDFNRIRNNSLREARGVKLVQEDPSALATARMSLFRSGLFSLASQCSAACRTSTEHICVPTVPPKMKAELHGLRTDHGWDKTELIV